VAALGIPKNIIDGVIAHARELDPAECCGLLAGKNGTVTNLYRIKNIVGSEGAVTLSHFNKAKMEDLKERSPEGRAEIAFVMDIRGLSQASKDMREQGLDLLCVYHSHTKDPATPSITDVEIATEFEAYWPIMKLAVPAYLIISLENKTNPDLRIFWIRQSQVNPAEFHVV
jgi:[CysO sulfur-carrier protein]-S-L-cysteine hydrolase